MREFSVAQWVKNLALSLQRLRVLLWCGFDPRPGNFHMPRAWPKKREKKKKTVSMYMCISISQITWNQWPWYNDFEGSVQKKIQSLPGLCSYSLTQRKPSKLKSNLPTTSRLIFRNAIIMIFLSSPIQSNLNLKRLILRFTFCLNIFEIWVHDSYFLFLKVQYCSAIIHLRSLKN